ncbi:MAG TPA: lysophospholipid acyltransferase family protein [Polyangia bacterium]|nr:lysophospholipid acyltransferase family protein [Polyangia bacterium]
MIAFVVDVPLWLLSLLFDPRRRAIHVWHMAIGRAIVHVNPFWRVRVEGPNRLPAGRFVVCANHQSNADIFCLGFVRGQFRYLAKQSLLRVPVFGWVMQMGGHISVERGERASGEQALARCQWWLERGISVAFFPEGTRSESGRIKEFKMGAFKLAVEAGVPVLPIVISGTATALPKHGFVMRERARVRLRLLAPIPAGPDAEALRDRTRAALIAAHAELEASPAGQ